MARAISYRRFSSGAQASGDSLKRQTEAAQAYCDAHGDILDVSFIDAGMSAYRGKNATQGALRRLVELAEQGAFEPQTKLIVEHLDRLSRVDVPAANEQFTRLLRSGLTIVTLMDGQTYTYERLKTDVGALLISIVLMFNANRESANKGERVARAKASRRERVRAGQAKMTRQCPAWLRPVGDGENFRFEPVPERVDLVKRIFDLSLAGLGKRSIVARLNREKVPPFRGGDGWHHSSVAGILRNDAVIGVFRPTRSVDGKVVRTGEIISDYYPSILAEAIFYRAQEATVARREPRAAGRKSIGLRNLFSGLGKCDHCGGNLVLGSRATRRRSPDRRQHYFLICGRAARHHGCDNDHEHPYAAVEATVLKTLSQFDVTRILGQAADPDIKRSAELEAEIAGKTAEVDHLFVAWHQEASPGARRRIQKLEQEIAEAEADLEVHRRQVRVADANRSRDQHGEFVMRVRRMNEEVMPAEDRYLMRVSIAAELRRLIASMEADGETLTITLRANDRSREMKLILVRGSLRHLHTEPDDLLATNVVNELAADALRAIGATVVTDDEVRASA
jgi:hypothetical protein